MCLTGWSSTMHLSASNASCCSLAAAGVHKTAIGWTCAGAWLLPQQLLALHRLLPHNQQQHGRFWGSRSVLTAGLLLCSFSYKTSAVGGLLHAWLFLQQLLVQCSVQQQLARLWESLSLTAQCADAGAASALAR